MINNNHKNSGCGFAEELVSYLYGESDEAQNPRFRKHLATCEACADELAAFSDVHFSINDWKINEFENLPTPVIEIPYRAEPQKQEVSSVEVSWLAGLRQSLSFAPSWSLAGAAMVILVLCAGLVLLVSDSQTGSDRAASNKNSEILASPTAEKLPERSNAKSNQNDLPDTESKAPDKPSTPRQPELAIQPDSKNNLPVRTSNPQRRTPKSETSNLPKKADAVRDDKKKNEIPPKIFDDEEEDETLRLAEMLEEIDTVE